MEDILTETPPPSRFHQDDLDNFAPPSPPIPYPFLSFSGEPLRPSTLIIAVSFPSLLALHRLFPSKTLIGTLTLPEIPFSGRGNSLHSSSSIDIYGVGGSVAAVLVRVPVSAERSHAVAGALIGSRISPERVVIFDSVRRRHFRGPGLSGDDERAVAFRLETSAQRKRASGPDGLFDGLDYLPSGSVVDGLGAALLARCQVAGIAATLCATWPESSGSVVSLVKSLVKSVLPESDETGCDGNEVSGFDSRVDRLFDSEMYT